jgi:hypothetical protein
MKTKEKQKIKPLSDWEWDLTWSSLRYFCGRYTIASAMYPSDLVRNFGKRLSEQQGKSLAEEIQRQIDYAMNHDDNMWLSHDMEAWSALRNYLEKSTWKELFCQGPDIEDTNIVAFPCERKEGDTMETRWIPVDKYENTGSTRTTVYEAYIKQIKEYEPK